MLKRRSLVLLVMALLLAATPGCGGAQRSAEAPTATKTPRPTFTEVPPPTDTPAVTLTPPATETPEPTATFTPEPTATRKPAPPTARPPTATPAPQVGSHGVLGRLSLRDGRSEYGVNQQVFFHMEIENRTDAAVRFGIIGLKPDHDAPFQTSWTSDVYDWKFEVNQTFKHDDRIIFTAPGTYTVRLAICFSTYNDCRGGGADWEEFSPVVVTIR